MKILVLTGSRRDLLKDEQPTEFVDRIFASAREIEKANPDLRFSFRFRACSADRTPFLLAEALNEEPFDGVIYSGGYSLVLGAGLQESLLSNRYHENIQYYSSEFQSFLDSGQLDREYLPGSWKKDLVKTEKSWLFGQNKWIPAICVPGSDSISLGLSSHLSVTENPSGSEPRPAVGLGRSDSALRTLHRVLSSPQSCAIGFDQNCDHSGAGAQDLRRQMEKLGFCVPVIELNGSTRFSDLELKSMAMLFVGTHKSNSLLKELDQAAELVVFCPAKAAMDQSWYEHINDLMELENTFCVGVGAYENAALLLCRILGKESNLAAMWKSRNLKTISSVMEPIGSLERS